MAENNSSDSAPNSAADNAAAADTSPVEVKPGSGRGLGIVAILISIAALGASVFVWYRTNVEQRLEQGMAVANLTGDIKGLQQNLDIVQKEQAKLVARIDSDYGKITAQHEKLAQRQDGLDDTVTATIAKNVGPLKEQQAKLDQTMGVLTQSVEKVYADLDRSLDSWALEEVEQLLRIANHSARLARDAGTALAALELADRRLEALGNPKLLQVRSEIAEEMAALKTVQPVDLAGIALKLANLNESIDQMPLANQPQRKLGGGTTATGETAQQAAAEEENKWLQAGREIVTDLRKLVRIQNVSKPAKPLLAPKERYFLYGNLHLMLSGAQFAALREDGATFSANVKQAQQWLGDYFDPKVEAVSQAIADLGAMAKVELSPEIPDISTSLASLKKIKAGMSAK